MGGELADGDVRITCAACCAAALATLSNSTWHSEPCLGWFGARGCRAVLALCRAGHEDSVGLAKRSLRRLHRVLTRGLFVLAVWAWTFMA